jgi:ubiquinol-cytochrome c reductase cytochrome b subunit
MPRRHFCASSTAEPSAHPVPRNLNYPWAFGAIMLVAQIATGVVLAMHYVPSEAEAFDSVTDIMRNVNHGP